jgi:hypothetical protein
LSLNLRENKMADAAFPTAKYPAYTTAQLESFVAAGNANAAAMSAEIARRARVAAGDRSVMTAGERLRAARAEG